MSISTGSRSQVGIVVETVYGTTPATPSLTGLAYTDFSVNLTHDEYEDNTIRADRMERYSITGNNHVAGDITANFSALNFDSLLESLMSSLFTTNVLKIGSTRKSFSMEEAQSDISIYNVFTGVLVDKLDLTVPSDAIVTAKFSVVGKDQSAYASTSIDTDGYTAPAAARPFTHLGGTFKEGGVVVGYITSIDLSVDNGYTANYSLGNAACRDMTYNMIKVSGTVNAYFEDSVFVNKFMNQTVSSLDFTLTDGTHTMEFNMPNVKYTGATKTVNGQGPVTIALPFKALYDSVSANVLTITRT